MWVQHIVQSLKEKQQKGRQCQKGLTQVTQCMGTQYIISIVQRSKSSILYALHKITHFLHLHKINEKRKMPLLISTWGKISTSILPTIPFLDFKISRNSGRKSRSRSLVATLVSSATIFKDKTQHRHIIIITHNNIICFVSYVRGDHNVFWRKSVRQTVLYHVKACQVLYLEPFSHLTINTINSSSLIWAWTLDVMLASMGEGANGLQYMCVCGCTCMLRLSFCTLNQPFKFKSEVREFRHYFQFRSKGSHIK